MASWQARILVPLLMITIKRRLRDTHDIQKVRGILGANSPRVSSKVVASPGQPGGVPGEWSRPRGETPVAIMLYLHGGGYSACSPQTHRPVTNGFAKAGFEVYAPAYRLAPEHPFPCAIEDAAAVYRALRASRPEPNHIVIAGDSAGGGLALATLVKLRDLGEPMPVAVMLFSPWTDMTCSGPSIETNTKHCAMFDAKTLQAGAELYLAGADPHDPLASPVFADLRGLPPMHIHASSHECLLDDSTRVAECARAAGVPCELRQWPHVPHAWQLMTFLPEQKESMAAATGFLRDAVAVANAHENDDAAKPHVRLAK